LNCHLYKTNCGAIKKCEGERGKRERGRERERERERDGGDIRVGKKNKER
jgi:hypothetical protein